MNYLNMDDSFGIFNETINSEVYVDLAYMTGVLPIAKYSSGSELNMFDEYNFMNDNIYDRFFGFSEEVHDREIPFLKYSDENSLSCVITLCYLYARKDYIIERELKCGKGYCDYIFFPKKKGKPAIILELKVGSSSEQAIAQMKEKIISSGWKNAYNRNGRSYCYVIRQWNKKSLSCMAFLLRYK